MGVRDRQRTPTGDRVAGDVTSGGLHSHQSRWKLRAEMVLLIWWVSISSINDQDGIFKELNYISYLRNLPSPFCFLLNEFHCNFQYLIKYYHMIIIIIVFSLGRDRPSGLFLRARSTSFHTHASLLTFFVCCFISFLLFLCLSVWENTCAWVPHFLLPYWMVPYFFAKRDDLLGRESPVKN